MDPDSDLKALLRAIVSGDETDDAESLEDEPSAPLSPFGQQLMLAVREAIDSMRAEGVLEVEDELVEALTREVTEAGLESNSPKQLRKKVLLALIDSDRVEEIYGTDEMLNATLGRFLGAE